MKVREADDLKRRGRLHDTGPLQNLKQIKPLTEPVKFTKMLLGFIAPFFIWSLVQCRQTLAPRHPWHTFSYACDTCTVMTEYMPRHDCAVASLMLRLKGTYCDP